MTEKSSPQPGPSDEMRADFERNITSHLSPLHLLSLDRDAETGRYLDPAVFGAWWGYCNAAATIAHPHAEHFTEGAWVHISQHFYLHPRTAQLVSRFARALAEKLAAAEKKYGYSDGWADAGWMDECRTRLLEHLDKGDPRDVAAYCAFLWHHGESTAAPVYTAPIPAPEGGPSLTDEQINKLLLRSDHSVMTWDREPKSIWTRYQAAALIRDALALAAPAAQAAPAITDAEIDRIAALTEKGMEEGLRGFLKTWGWQQFARTLVENLRPYGLRIAPKEPTNDR